jgi:hypothetical protein
MNNAIALPTMVLRITRSRLWRRYFKMATARDGDADRERERHGDDRRIPIWLSPPIATAALMLAPTKMRSRPGGAQRAMSSRSCCATAAASRSLHPPVRRARKTLR